MSPFTVLVLCIQACLIQSVMSQCGCGSGYSNLYNYGAVPVANAGCGGGFGGSGCGTVGTSGIIDACGETQVAGAVPVMGTVAFGGCAPACGAVSLCGQCGCGCS